ncbi:MAG: penicillin acylase family protein [Saprospiraceae bacterium]
MKIVKFILSLLLTAGLIYQMGRPITLKEPVADKPGTFKETVIPPIGHFFSPFAGFWQNAESLKDYVPQQLEIPEMKGKVKILFDERMVPHIFAENLEDAVFAQGYVTARFRLWQMDMLSRLPGGRLSEILGADLVETDKMMRRRGLAQSAETTVNSWQQSPETFQLIEAYGRGVNKYVQQLNAKDFPLEFKLLNYAPENWAPIKSALVKKYMDLTLCFAEEDLEATNALKVFGQDLFNKLYPEWNRKQSPVIPTGTKWNFTPPSPAGQKQEIQEAIGLIHHKVYPKERELVGSNNWAVSGSKTKSGKPILCNDPHLQLSLPSIWFEVQIHTPELNAYGVSIPGIPGILIGFNANTAWGETNVGQDVLDWYKIKWTDATETAYEMDGEIKKASLVVNPIRVRGQEEPVLDTVRWTEWGPVVYESDKNPRHDLAMHWLANEAPNPSDIATFLGLDRGENYDDYATALTHYDYPAQNFVFASKSGDIAITVNGKFPIKEKEQGRFVQDGSLSANRWKGWIPRTDIPKVKNPGRGFVASANQHSTDPSYPYYYNSSSFDDYRGRYLVQQLSSMDSITPEEMMALQNSNYSILAAEGLPAMLDQLDTAGLGAVAAGLVAKMRTWDFRFDADKVEPAIFEEWWGHFYEMTFDEVLAWKDSMPMLMPENWRLIELANSSPNDPIFDVTNTPEKETAREIATRSFKKTLAAMADDLVNPTFNWSSKKGTEILHLARIPAFSRKNIAVGGYRQALNAISERHGPSWRMVVELGDEVKAWGVYPGGQSGTPGSPFYDNGIEQWRKGEYNELFFMKNTEDARKPILFRIEMN